MCICAFDEDGNLANQWTKQGARYVSNITYQHGVVIFTGQSNLKVAVTLEELLVPPSVSEVDCISCPVLPKHLTYSSTRIPVVAVGPYCYWPSSYADGSDGYAIVVTDARQRVLRYLIKCPGARSIQYIKVDPNVQEVHLIGSDSRITHLSYDSITGAYRYNLYYTKKDFLALAEFFGLSLSEEEAATLENRMPSGSCAAYRGLQAKSIHEQKWARTVTQNYVNVGSTIGGLAGALGGFLLGGEVAAAAGFDIGATACRGIGKAIELSGFYTRYVVSRIERERTVIRYAQH